MAIFKFKIKMTTDIFQMYLFRRRDTSSTTKEMKLKKIGISDASRVEVVMPKASDKRLAN